MANKKKALRILNPTKHFNPEVSRTHNTIASPYSYQSRQQKIEGYETRLYWQYRYCDEHDGQTFFYTLTYNDRHIPTYYGVPCFDYNDLVDIVFEGAFRKRLLRQYGTKMKYFVGAELGDGKGERGMHNNPHYHVLFFLEPADNPRYPYIKISPEDFRHEVRMAWQGFDEEEGFHDYRTAKKGIAREGENLGKVTDYRACMYVAKYVSKDAKLVRAEGFIQYHLREDLIDLYRYKPECLRAFYNEVMEEEDLDSPLPWDDEDTMELYARAGYDDKAVEKIIETDGLQSRYKEFVEEYIKPILKDKMKEFRNRHTNKCRISQGVGDYALQFITDKLNPTISVPDKDGFKARPIGMYYYRKLFTDYYIDEDGSVIRYLNEDGISYKMFHLPECLDKLSTKAENNLRYVLNHPDLYNRFRESDCNEQVFLPWKEFFDEYNYLLLDNENNDIKEISKRYAEYKFIYEDRYFPYEANRTILHDCFPTLTPELDYLRFISTRPVDNGGYRSLFFMENPDKDYLPYFSHPYFLRYMFLFSVLDLCADYLFVQDDNYKQKEAEERAAVKRFHDKIKMKEFYAGFGI